MESLLLSYTNLSQILLHLPHKTEHVDGDNYNIEFWKFFFSIFMTNVFRFLKWIIEQTIKFVVWSNKSNKMNVCCLFLIPFLALQCFMTYKIFWWEWIEVEWGEIDGKFKLFLSDEEFFLDKDYMDFLAHYLKCL